MTSLPATATAPASINVLKASFVNNKGLIHLNNAGLAPSSREAQTQVVYWMERFRSEGMHCNDAYLAAVDGARVQLAEFLNCDAGEIAFFQSTAGGISQIAFGMKLSPGDEVLTWDEEYPSNLYPWKAACDRVGATLKLVPSSKAGYSPAKGLSTTSGSLFKNWQSTPSERLLAAITEKTKVIAISWVQYQSGAISDLEAITKIARAQGIWTVIDGIQGIGLMPFDFKKLGVDAVCGGSHKWMLSPVGVGYLAVREDRVRELQPLIIGAATYGTCDDPTDFECLPKTNAWKFEAGSKQVLEIVALGASAQLIREIGIELILEESERLARRLRMGLLEAGLQVHTPHQHDQLGSIVCFSDSTPDKTNHLEATLRNNRISYALRGPGIRLSPHAFNFDEEIDKTLRLLSANGR